MAEIPWNSILPLVGVAIGFGGNILMQNSQHQREDKRIKDERSIAHLKELLTLLLETKKSVDAMYKSAMASLIYDQKFNLESMVIDELAEIEPYFIIFAPQLEDRLSELKSIIVDEMMQEIVNVPTMLGAPEIQRDDLRNKLSPIYQSFDNKFSKIQKEIAALIVSKGLV